MELARKKRAETQQEMYDQWTTPKTNEEYLAEIIESSAPQHAWPGHSYLLGINAPGTQHSIPKSTDQSWLQQSPEQQPTGQLAHRQDNWPEPAKMQQMQVLPTMERLSSNQLMESFGPETLCHSEDYPVPLPPCDLPIY